MGTAAEKALAARNARRVENQEPQFAGKWPRTVVASILGGNGMSPMAGG
jgi:hypothetical protein